MLCRNCFKMVSDDAKFCPECGAELNPGENNQEIRADLDSFGSGNAPHMTLSEQNKNSSSMPGDRLKQSKLAIAAAILAVLGCTSGIGLILGIIDLVKNKKDGNKHGASIFAVIWGGGISFVVMAFVIIGLFVGDYNSGEADSRSIAEEPVTRTEIVDDNAPNSESVIDDEKSVLTETDNVAAVETKKTEGTETEKEDNDAPDVKKDLTQEIEAALASELTIPEKVFKISDYPEYKEDPYIEVNGNHPFFEEKIKESITLDAEVGEQGLQYYSALDQLGRCGMAYEIVSKEILPTEERGQIGDLQPSGWQTVKYPDIIEDLYLYNRCHLIGYQLGGGNGDEQNLITGTRYLNMSGMLPFENTVAKYVEDIGNHVAYRVTPIFENNNLIASGVLMEAFSIEDSGAGVDFCIYAYNIQPGIEIDYATGDSREAVELIVPNESTQAEGYPNSRSIPDNTSVENESNATVSEMSDDSSGSGKSGSGKSSNFDTYDNPEQQNTTDAWVLNKSSKKIHYPNCKSVPKIAPKNYATSNENVETLEGKGYSKCKQCFK